MARPDVSSTTEDLYEALGPLRADDEDRDWPLLRFCQVVAAPVAEVADLAYDTDTVAGWSALLDPSACPPKALPWLGQLVGAVVPVGADDVTARAIVAHSPGWARGTPAAILGTARLWLTGSQAAKLTERFGGSAYAVELTVYAAQVIDVSSLTAAVKATLPAGFSFTLNQLVGWTIAEMEAGTTTMGQAEIDFPTMADFETEIP